MAKFKVWSYNCELQHINSLILEERANEGESRSASDTVRLLRLFSLPKYTWMPKKTLHFSTGILEGQSPLPCGVWRIIEPHNHSVGFPKMWLTPVCTISITSSHSAGIKCADSHSLKVVMSQRIYRFSLTAKKTPEFFSVQHHKAG